MNPRVVIPTISLAINVLLVAAWAHSHPAASARQRDPVRADNTAAPVASPRSTSSITSTPTPRPIAAPLFEWAQLQSTNFVEYLQNLRAFGVPEQNVRDIIIAAVKKEFRPRFAAIRMSRSVATNSVANTNLWTFSHPWMREDSDLTALQRNQLFDLQQEQDAFIKSLLGWDVFRLTALESSFPGWRERNIGPFPPEKQEELITLRQRFDNERTEIYRKADGYLDQDIQNELRQLTARQHEELARVLTPAETLEFDLRNSDTAGQLRWDMSAMNLTEQEFRNIFAYKQAQEDLKATAATADDENPRSPEQVAADSAKQAEIDNAFARQLSPERMKQYQLSDDWTYRNLLQSGVSMDSVVKVADIKTEVETAAAKIRTDPSLNDDQRQAALKEISDQTKKALGDLLGARRANSYPNNGGWWVNQIVPGN